MLSYPKHGGAQRVQNWKYRGIPPAVKLQHPRLFLRRQPVCSGGDVDAPPDNGLRRRSTDRPGSSHG